MYILVQVSMTMPAIIAAVTPEEVGGIGGEYEAEVSLVDNGLRELPPLITPPIESSCLSFLYCHLPPTVLPSCWTLYKVCGLQSTVLDKVTMF